MKQNGGGSAGKHAPGEREHEYSWWVTFAAHAQPGLQSEQLLISITGAPGGGTLLLAEPQVVWTTPRPAAERVPPGVSRIEVIRATTVAEELDKERASLERRPALKGTHVSRPAHGVVTLRRVISSPVAVARIVAAFERLPIVQPGTIICPAGAEGPVVRLTFRGRAGKVLA
jgi:hypothetical protein